MRLQKIKFVFGAGDYSPISGGENMYNIVGGKKGELPSNYLTKYVSFRNTNLSQLEKLNGINSNKDRFEAQWHI